MQWEHQSAEERHSVTVTKGGKPIPGLRSDRISSVDEEVMCWRKANHIHAWFVANVQDGSDDMRDYYVTSDKLRELLDVCEKVIKASKLVDGTVDGGTVYDKEHPNGLKQRLPGQVIEDSTVAEKLLPTQPGFFFGSYEYDEWYLNDVVETREWILRMLAEHEQVGFADLVYSSSW